MELRATYIPNDESGNSKIRFSFRQNLRFRKTDTFVTAPALISVQLLKKTLNLILIIVWLLEKV